MVGAASDASTKFDDEPLMVALPCYMQGEQTRKEVSSSDDDKGYPQPQQNGQARPEVAYYLANENRRLEEENAFLKMQYASCLQMAQQGLLGNYGLAPGLVAPPGLVPGFGNPAMLQMQYGLPQMCSPGVQQQSVQPQHHEKRVSSSDALPELECDGDCSSDTEVAKTAPRTSVMLRNLPNSYTRQLLLNLLDSQGFAGKYDFVYLPIDFKTRLSLAYAFINLVNVEEAKRFWKHFHGFSNWAVPSHKVARVNWSEFQGLASHIERYRSSPVMHDGVPDEYKPVLLSGGKRSSFPMPKEKVRAPRCRVRSKPMQPGRVA